MALKFTIIPGERAKRLVTTGADMPLTFGLGALQNLAAFYQMHIQSVRAVRFTLGLEKNIVYFISSLTHSQKKTRGNVPILMLTPQ